MAMTGIYGAPLELVKGFLEASASFQAFSTDRTVHLYQRIGDGTDPEAGDAWAVLAYREKQHTLTRQAAGPGLANWDAKRVLVLSLVELVEAPTNSELEGLINAAGAIVEDIIDNDDAAVLGECRLVNIGVDESTEPIALGAEIEMELDE